MSELGVAEIWQYPVKSMGGTQLEETWVTSMGIEGDREFAVFDRETGTILSRKQPQSKRLLEVTASLSDGMLRLDHPDLGSIEYEYRTGAPGYTGIKVLDDTVGGVSQNYLFTEYLLELFGQKRDIELIRIPSDHQRLVDPSFLAREFHTTYTDGYPLTIVSRESLAALRGAMGNPAELPANLNDLVRANIVIEGGATFEEDHLGDVIIGSVLAAICKASTRCVMTEQYLDENGKVAKERLKTLQSLRRMGRIGFNGTNETPKAMIAQNAVVLGPGRMSINDIVHVRSETKAPNWRNTKQED